MADRATLDSPGEAIYFFVADPNTGIAGYVWRVGWRSTSFYIKPTWKVLSGLKISLHGPDARHSGPVFLVSKDESAGDVTANGGMMIDLSDGQRRSFSGAPILGAEGTVLAARFRSTWSLFREGSKSGPRPADLKGAKVGACLPAPTLFHATDLELFVSSGAPFWPNEAQARKDNACLGPLINEADQYLTAVSRRASVASSPTPSAFVGKEPEGERTRGIRTIVDPEWDFLWVIEDWLPISMFGNLAQAGGDGL
jgi:hypothetical protein